MLNSFHIFTGRLLRKFLSTFHSNYSRIISHLGDIQRQRMAWSWHLGLGSFKVIDHVRLFYRSAVVTTL